MFTADGSTVIRKGVTNAQGKLTLRGLPNGSYVLKETNTAEGYVLPADSYPVTVKEAKAVIGQQSGAQANQIAVKNLKASSVGNLTVTKEVTGNRGEFQKEFSFTLKLENATGAYPYSKTWQNSAEAGEEPAVETGMLKDGDTFALQHGESITIRNIPKETAYTVVEADYSAEGYVTRVTSTPPMEPTATAAAARTVTGTIGAERNAEAHFINDKFVQGTLRIQKVAAFDGKTPLEGATFQVTGRDKVYYEIVTTDDLGVATIADLPLDVPLTLTELEAPEGYLVSEPVTFTLSDAASHVIQVENTRKGVLHLTKTAAYDGTTPLAGAVFTVTGEGVTFSNNTLTTDENGKASLTDLPVGVELTLTETKAPYGYQLLGEPVTFTLADNETNAVVTQEISLKNLRKGILHIEKVASSDPERFLAGAEFTVTDGGGRQYGGVLVTDETGNITLTDLPLDVPLTLTETRAPSGYRMSGQPVNFTLTEGTEENPTAYEQTITVQNARKHSGGSNATTPMEPVEPVTPVGPADPVDPAEPVAPIEPVDPTNPSEPTESHPSEPPLDQPIAPSRVEKLPDNGIRGQISRDDPEYYLDENGVPRGIPPVEDPYYWLDEAGVPLGYLSPEGDWIWIEDAAVPLGFQTPEGNWVSFVPQTGDDSGQRLLLFLLSGGALLGLSAWGLLRRRNREEGD